MADQIQVVPQPSAETVTQASDPLFVISAVFPFHLFPDKIVVDRFKIDVIQKALLDEKIITIPMSGNVIVNVDRGVFFSSVEIHDPTTLHHPIVVSYLSNEDANNFRKLIMGMVVGIKQGVNFMGMESTEVINSSINWGGIDA
ncbi:MAG TPA: hypothetical protein VD999_01510 [Vitreimonas sp.]|nr:hypothetical protein [Vitreimonas sp.]